MDVLSQSADSNIMRTLLLLLIIGSLGSIEGRGQQYVTCGSVIKLLNIGYKVRLHSHDVKYGTGSGQQSVTGTEAQEDVNSHWAIKGETKKHCNRGEAVKCGDTIRLQHLATTKNLHSHHFSSPLSGNQEVSAYGDDAGLGDTGDHWIATCDTTYWTRDSPVQFKHADTDAYLAVSGKTYGRPISGQAEVVAVASAGSNYVDWQTTEGLFVHPTDMMPKQQQLHNEYHHSEL